MTLWVGKFRVYSKVMLLNYLFISLDVKDVKDHSKQDSRNDDARGFKESVDRNKAYQKLRFTRLGK